MSAHVMKLTLACAVSATLPCVARANTSSGIELLHGPIAPQVARVVDVRTPYPSASVKLFLSASGGPSSPADPQLPTLDVAASARALQFTTDAQGRVRIVLPPQPAVGGPARLHVQAAVRSPDGAWETTDAKTVRRAPSAAAAAWLVPATGPVLPPAAATARVGQFLALDVDRDGDDDLLATHEDGVWVWIDDGAAGFVEETQARFALGVRAVSCLAAADVDRDGDVDVFVGGAIDALGNVWPDELWLGDANGVFTRDASFPGGNGATTSAEFGDIDSDGLPDLVLGRGTVGHGPLALGPCQLLHNVFGSFVADAAFANASWNDGLTPAPAVRFGDVDDDGDLDLFVARADLSAAHGGTGELNRLVVNDGAGNFTDETAARFATLYSDNTADARFVDFDLDGDLDLVVLNQFTAGIGPLGSGDLWINQGHAQGGTTGTFVEDTTSPFESLPLGANIQLGAHPADADADGDVDLLVLVHGITSFSRHLLFVNQGGAQGGVLGELVLDASFDTSGPYIATAAAWLDRDHDGDLELVLSSLGTISGPPALASGVFWFDNTTP